ncbi:benomyl/methotrexate resistance protein [Choiromyces venosus 120613-1]|uniref:Benomyl/methotrexate resistance protein n=1 Tax=Choiromyces venosus 120613-1 TaxID=1336337 RepID=A0A3N4J862_9PEZI|nr:benomyl/methotrexate resistance protein [Choiromyces venosus 120613-1]
MAELEDLERVISNLSGFHRPDEDKEIEAELRKELEEKREVEEEDAASINPDIVDWDGPDDPENPMNWPRWRKVVAVGIVSGITFVTPLASSMFAPGVPQLMRDFHSTDLQLGSFVVSIYVLGFAFGPLVLAPASELWGRQIIYNVSNLCFGLCTIGCAKASGFGMLAAFRFLAGAFGAAPLTIGGGTIADVVAVQKRGGAMALYALGPLLGPVIGPIGGGFLTQAKGWRWVFWVIAIISAAIAISTFVFLKETYAPTILEAKAARLRKSTGNQELRSKFASELPQREAFLRALVRPLKMLFLSPIVLALSVFMAIVYGYIYLLFTTFPTVFRETYGFTTGTVGLCYIGIGVGSLLGLLACGVLSDHILKSRAAASDETKPEYRLVPMVYAAVCVPIGLFWYGWSAHEKTHYVAPIIGTAFVGAGMIGSFVPITTYIVDAFTIYAASALAANTVLRSVLGAALPLAGPSMYGALGLGWGNSLLAFIAVALLPVPIVFVRYGEKIRKRWEVQL